MNIFFIMTKHSDRLGRALYEAATIGEGLPTLDGILSMDEKAIKSCSCFSPRIRHAALKCRGQYIQVDWDKNPDDLEVRVNDPSIETFKILLMNGLLREMALNVADGRDVRWIVSDCEAAKS